MNDSTAKKQVIRETLYNRLSCENNNYKFNKKDKPMYEDLFIQFKTEGLITNDCNFDDSIWFLVDKKTNRTTKLKFELELMKDFMLALKFLTLNDLRTGFTVDVLRMMTSKMIETYMDTEGYRVDKLNDYQDLFNSYGYRKRENIVIKNIQFAEYFNGLIPAEYINFFKSVPIGHRNIRKLPNYESVINFDFIINDFYNNIDDKNLRKKFYPIYLWWKITSIIPMRPIEFLNFKSDCIYKSENNYLINVPREKNKGNSSRLEVTNKLQINKEIYDLVNEYLSLLKEDEKSHYLFSYIAYNSFIKNERLRKGALTKRNRTDKMDNTQFYELLDDFYIEIVDNMYGYKEIERINAGDTRHFAFCNMMLQGFNMLTIARIGGHLNLQSQLSYCSHLDYFAEAKMKILSDQIKKNRFSKLGDTYLDENNALIVRSKLYTNDGTGLKIGNNLCLDKEFPNNCIRDCIFCPHYIIDLTQPNAIKDIKLKASNVNKNIKNVIATMQQISKEMIYDTENIKYSQLDQEKLFNLANKLNKLFNEKAMLDSYIDEVEEI